MVKKAGGLNMVSTRRLFEKKEGHCDYCHTRFDSFDKVRRNLKEGLVVCNNCHRRYLRHGTFNHESNFRRLFEKREGFCDYCDKKLRSRNKFEDMVVCKKCKIRVWKNGKIEYRVPFTEAERAQRRVESSVAYNDERNAKQAYLESIPPEKLLKIVRRKR